MNDLQNFTSGVFVPVFQAVFTGLLLAAVVICFGWFAGFGFLAAVGGLAFAAGAFLSWCLALAFWMRLNLHTAGAFQAQDRDQTYIDAPYRETVTVEEDEPAQLEPVMIRVELKQSNRLQIIDLPASGDQLRRLAVGVLQGESLAESVWCGAGRPFSRSQFAQLRGELIKRNLAFWLHPDAPSQGWRLNAAGVAILRQITSPSLLDDGRG